MIDAASVAPDGVDAGAESQRRRQGCEAEIAADRRGRAAGNRHGASAERRSPAVADRDGVRRGQPVRAGVEETELRHDDRLSRIDPERRAHGTGIHIIADRADRGRRRDGLARALRGRVSRRQCAGGTVRVVGIVELEAGGGPQSVVLAAGRTKVCRSRLSAQVGQFLARSGVEGGDWNAVPAAVVGAESPLARQRKRLRGEDGAAIAPDDCHQSGA